MKSAIAELVIDGIDTNRDFIYKILENKNFITNNYDTSFIKKEFGELQLTDYGLSGICIFNLSGIVSSGLDKNFKEVVVINFMPWTNDALGELKKLDKLTKYVIYPNTRFYGGYTYDGKDIELCDDSDSIKNEKGKEVFKINVKQKILNGVLYTDINSTKTYKDDTKQFDTIHQELQLKKGQLLVYS